ncbi:MAG: DUF1178 family protein [Deltaproteobacteria bacterium]|nr:DUF1178 family protein [Deltaproteobacteria bacterium]
MIVFQLACENRHPFEGWFRNREDFEAQLAEGLLTCPVCGSTRITKELSPIAVHVGRRSGPKEGTSAPAPSGGGAPGPVTPQAFFKALATFVETHFEDVGGAFAQEARKIESGEAEARNIRGTTTPDEEDALREEGIEFLKVPIPKYDA